MTETSMPTRRTPTSARNHILEQLRPDGRVDAAEIAAELGVTGETIRKDLIALERQGLLRRVHGGAVPVAVAVLRAGGGDPHRVRRREDPHRAGRTGTPARRGSVLIDAGSTTAQLVELFPGDRELTVYTNTLPLACRC